MKEHLFQADHFPEVPLLAKKDGYRIVFYGSLTLLVLCYKMWLHTHVVDK